MDPSAPKAAPQDDKIWKGVAEGRYRPQSLWINFVLIAVNNAFVA
jgi:hypothetical protein